MPKIIENLEPRLLEEAKKQINENGYGAMTIRSVASACGVSVGTVYNYFDSKDALVATYMLNDWMECMTIIRDSSMISANPKPVARAVYEQLCEYAKRHQSVFQDPSASSAFAGSFSRYHALLRQQLAEPLQKFCADYFHAEFIAESLLTWTMAQKSFDEIYGVISKLFCE